MEELIKIISKSVKNFRNISSVKNRNLILLNWPYLIIYYFIVRQIVGLQYGMIYLFLFFLILARISFITISLIFFVAGCVVYLLGQYQEASNYMSFVFGFLFLTVIDTYIRILIVKKK